MIRTTDSNPPPPRLSEVANRFRPYCTACGQCCIPIDHGRCIACVGAPLAFCWRCGIDIHRDAQHAIVTAHQQAREVVQNWWQERGGSKALRDVERVLRARQEAGRC